MAKDLNVSPSYLCKVETGLQNPTLRFKENCAEYLDENVNILFPEKIDKKSINNLSSNLSNNLWNTRKEKGVKQYELAKLLGCSPSYLSKVEKGQLMPNEKFKNKCAMILKVKKYYCFHRYYSF